MESVLNDGRVIDLLDELETKDKGLVEQIRSFLEDVAQLLHEIIQAYKGKKPNSPEGRIVQRMTGIYEQLQQVFAEGLHEGGENYREGGKENTAQQGGVKYSFKNSANGMANDALLPYDAEMENLIKQKGNIIVDNFDKLKEVVDLAFDKPNVKATVYFGALDPAFLESIQRGVPNLPAELKGALFKKDRSYSIAATLDSIRHLTDDKPGMTKDDVLDYLDRMADVIIHADSVMYSQYTDNRGQKNNGLRFKKAYSDGVMVSFEIVSQGKRSLNLQTLFMNSASYQKKKAAKTPLVHNTPAHTPKAWVSQPSKKTVPQHKPGVKKNFVRYQVNQAAQEHLRQQNAGMGEDVADLNDLVAAQRKRGGGMKGTALYAAAGHLMKTAGAKGDKYELAKLLNEYYRYIGQSTALTWDSLRQQAQPVVDWLMEHTVHSKQISEYARDILDHLRGCRIYLDDIQKGEAAHLYGSFGAYRNMLMGTVTVANENSISLDSLWQELSTGQFHLDGFVSPPCIKQ